MGTRYVGLLALKCPSLRQRNLERFYGKGSTRTPRSSSFRSLDDQKVSDYLHFDMRKICPSNAYSYLLSSIDGMTFDLFFLIPFDFSLSIFFNRINSIELMFRDLTNER